MYTDRACRNSTLMKQSIRATHADASWQPHPPHKRILLDLDTIDLLPKTWTKQKCKSVQITGGVSPPFKHLINALNLPVTHVFYSISLILKYCITSKFKIF